MLTSLCEDIGHVDPDSRFSKHAFAVQALVCDCGLWSCHAATQRLHEKYKISDLPTKRHLYGEMASHGITSVVRNNDGISNLESGMLILG